MIRSVIGSFESAGSRLILLKVLANPVLLAIAQALRRCFTRMLDSGKPMIERSIRPTKTRFEENLGQTNLADRFV